MKYKKGDIISIKGSDKKLSPAVVVQADWFNLGGPPAYVICPISVEVYPELDFRPLIKPDDKNSFPRIHQVMIDRIKVVKRDDILSKAGEIDNKQLKEINGCIKAILGI